MPTHARVPLGGACFWPHKTTLLPEKSRPEKLYLVQAVTAAGAGRWGRGMQFRPDLGRQGDLATVLPSTRILH